MNKLQNKYDAIIIGSGIGGLTCGCYLAKAGIKTLIVEKNANIGGYCSSFKRGSFIFDSAVHSFGNFSNKNAIHKIFMELGLIDKIKINRSNPSDTVRINNVCIKIDNDVNKTQANIMAFFPREKDSIKKFFDYIRQIKALECFVELKGKTFLQFLKAFFNDDKLINILSFPLGNIGLPADMTAAFSAVMLYRDFIFDGGYYPEGGMQNLANKIAEVFNEYGGEVIKNSKVDKIILKDKKAVGIKIKTEEIFSEYVISNCDGYQTFYELLDPNILSKEFAQRIKKGMTSISSYVLYLGLSEKIEKFLEKSCTLWYFDNFNINNIYSTALNNEVEIPPRYFLATFPTMHEPRLAPEGKGIMSLIVGVPFLSEKYWQANRNEMADSLINKALQVVPNLTDLIEKKTDATPHTLYRYTLNNNGAMCGWASTLDQVYKNRVNPETEICNFFMTGHWTTPPAGQGGVDVVIYSGKTTARLVVAHFKKNRQCALL